MYEIKKSTMKNKKYMAVFTNGKKVHFGDPSYQQFKDKTDLKLYSHLDHGDEQRKKSYYARHGKAAEKYTAKYFSHNFLW